MLRTLATIGAALAVAGAASAELLPRPAGLEPNVRFWKRIYSEVDGNGGLIHDTEELDVVYEWIRFPEGLSSRSRERRVERAKDQVRAALRVLAKGRRTGLSEEQARVLSRWPEGVSNATLKAAASRVRFQLGQADKFRAGVIRSGAWRDYIVDVLTSHGVPPELVALPHVESSYYPKAYSRVGAAGLWQFTRGTGRRYMRVDHVVDERMDPFRATEAAARLLRDNYAKTESWPLAITGYNHGISGMARAARQLGTRDIAVISRRYKSRTFGFASRNFYAEFLAALEVDRNATQHFGTFTYDRPVAYEIVELDHYYPVSSLAASFGLPLEVLRQHNPALRSAVWDGTKYAPRGFSVRVPSAEVAKPLKVALAEVPASKRFSRQHRDKYYKVRRGDTLSTIARRHNVRVSELVAVNHLRSRHRIRAGQVLVLPGRGGAPTVQVAQQEPPADGIHRVRRGDNLTLIAARYGVSASALARENGLRNRNHLKVGQKLRLPGHVPAARPPEAETTPAAVAEKPPAKVTLVQAEQPTPVTTSAAPVEEPASVPTATPAPEEALTLAANEKSAPAVASTEEASARTPLTAAAEPREKMPPERQPPAPEETAPGSAVPAQEAAEIVIEARAHAQPSREAVEPIPLAEPELEADAAEATPVVSDADEEAEPELADALEARPAESGAPLPDPSSYEVIDGQRIVIHAEETLGHYAEWLQVRASHLRRLNKMSYKTPLVIGRMLRLDFSRVTPEVFEEQRLAFHQAIQEDFFSSYVVTGTTQHTLRRGESLWYLAERKFRVPVWLLHQYNPDLDFGSLPAGASLVVPEVQPRRAG